MANNEICDCCKRPVPYVRGSAWHGNSRICLACFYVWYDPPGNPPEGATIDPEWIAATVLEAEKAGTYPFEYDDSRLRRVR